MAILGSIALAESNVDPDHPFAWCENLGWTNWRQADGAVQGVNVGASFLTGFLWSENVGWINIGDGAPASLCGAVPCYGNVESTDFGVNLDLDGVLHGLAWGENVGWINFDTAHGHDGARFDACRRRFYGFAWAENAGWINLDHALVYIGIGPCALGDIDCDGNVASYDYAVFQPLLGGPEVPVDCSAFDWDADGDIDLLDVAAFQVMFGEF